jgi:hypothetical protein
MGGRVAEELSESHSYLSSRFLTPSISLRS